MYAPPSLVGPRGCKELVLGFWSPNLHGNSFLVILPCLAASVYAFFRQDVFDFELSNQDVSAIDKLGERKIRMCNWKYRPGGGRIYEGETSAYPEK